MNLGTLLGLIACMGFTSASVLKIENRELPMSILTDTINGTIESLRERLSEYDPILLEDVSFSLSELGLIEVRKAEATGFSDFALTSLSASVLRRTLSGVLRLNGVSASVESASITSDALEVEAVISSINADVVGVTVDFTIQYQLVPPQITSLTVLPQIEGLDLVLRGSLNDVPSELIITSEEIVDFINEFLSDYQDAINSGLLNAINYLLGLISSYYSS